MSYPKTKQMNLEDGQTLLAAVDGKMSDLKSAIEHSKADIIKVVDSVSAPVKTLADGADGVPMGITFAVEPVQDLNGYDFPWPAGGYKNMVPGIEQGAINTTGTKTGNTARVRANDYIPVTGGETYTFKAVASATLQVMVYQYADDQHTERINTDADWKSIPYTFTTLSTANYVTVVVRKSNNADLAVSDVSGFQLETGSSATDYAPYGNICPISGRTEAMLTRLGKNVRISSRATANRYLKSDGSINSANGVWYTDYFRLKPNQDYIYCRETNPDSTIAFCVYDKDKKYLDGVGFGASYTKTIKTPSNAYYGRVSGYSLSKYPDRRVWLLEGTTDTGYEDVKEMNVTISFVDGSGDPLIFYGGTLTINKDWTGTLVPQFAYYDITNMTFQTLSSAGGFRCRAVDNTGMIEPLGRNATIISTHWKGITETDPLLNDYTKSWVFCTNNEQFVFSVGDPSMDTVAKLTAFLTAQSQAGTPVCVCYEISDRTPITLTAPQVLSLLGVNNLYADCGDILSVDYSADTKLYIDNDNAKQDAEITGTKGIIGDSMDGTVSRAVNKGELFIMNNTLYKAITNIANGATITPGTNCEATNISDEIAEYSETTMANGIYLRKFGRARMLIMKPYVIPPSVYPIYPSVSDLITAIQTLGVAWEAMYQTFKVGGYYGYIRNRADISSSSWDIAYMNGTTETEATNSMDVLGNLIWFE